LLLDEPLASLDPINAARLVEALIALKNEGCALVICEHREGLLGRLADGWFVLDRGELTPGEEPLFPDDGAKTPAVFSYSEASSAVLMNASDLSVQKGKTILISGLSLTVSKGEILLIRGPNGAGKSTLLKILSGLEAPLEGRLVVAGSVRLVGQHTLDQLCRAEVGEEAQVDLNARLRRGRPAPPSDEPESTLARVGLFSDTGRSPFLLSEGGKRRLVVACGVLAYPDILFLDEPTAGLDPMSSRTIAALLRDCAQGGMSVVCASHDEGFMSALGGRTINLADWKPPPQEVPFRAAWDSENAKSNRSATDPRPAFVGFLAGLAVVLQPLPSWVPATLLALLGLSYLIGGHLRALGTFCRSLALFWVFPGLVLFVFAGLREALDGLVRLGLLSLLFHRYSLSIEGKRLSAALSRWGVPYSLGFAISAALALVPALVDRLKMIGDLLLLRLSKFRSRPWQLGPGSRVRPRIPSPRVTAALLVPAVVHLWQHAAQLAMNLELRGFQGRAPRELLPKPMSWREVLVCISAVLAALTISVLLHRTS
jgi:ABC-type multidrug transport system ATPase subunit/energy-coupling factor transporter transmembrane protein EcfT